MSKSKFQELVGINEENHTETAAYVQRNYDFIKLFTKNLSLYLRAPQELLLVNSNGEINWVDNNIEDFITIENDLFFEFKLLLKISTSVNINLYPSVNTNLPNSLAPLTGIILVIAIKQCKNSFIIKVPAIEKEKKFDKEFVMEYNDNTSSSWIEIFDCCFEAMKEKVGSGVEKRISEQDIPTDGTSKKVIGFYNPLK
jgi:hypothetical protein